jgi:hypothetical protein
MNYFILSMAENEVREFIDYLSTEFKSLSRKILCKNITTNQDKLKEYTVNAIHLYNQSALYNANKFDNLGNDDKQALKELFILARDYLNKFSSALKFEIKLPTDIKVLININDISHFESGSELDSEFEENFDTEEEEAEENPITMAPLAAKSPVDFLGTCSSTLNKDFDGEPDNLQRFIDKINLLRKFATNKDLREVLLAFAISKLSTTTRSKIVVEPESIDELIQALKKNIKFESSDIIEGRLLAIKGKNLEEFAEKAEKLAEAYRQALVLESVGHEKAQQMAIDKTVRLCRSHSNSPEVKSVLASKTFTSTKEVISKMIVQINEVKNDRIHDFYKKNQPKNNKKNPNQTQNKDKPKFPYQQKQNDNNNQKPKNGKQDQKQGPYQGKPKPKNQYPPNGYPVYAIQGNEFFPQPFTQGDPHQQQQQQQRPTGIPQYRPNTQ